MSSGSTLYERLGGEQAIGAVVDEFYDRVLADDAVDHHFEDHDMGVLRVQLKRYVASLTGGPVDWVGTDMATAHGDLGISGRDFDVVAGHLDETLRDFDVPDAERTAVMEAVGGLRPEIVTQ